MHVNGILQLYHPAFGEQGRRDHEVKHIWARIATIVPIRENRRGVPGIDRASLKGFGQQSAVRLVPQENPHCCH